MRTLLVGDEPRDIVFAGPGRQPRLHHHRAPRPEHAAPPIRSSRRPGVGRADVWVFDATNLGTTLGGTPLDHRRRCSATRRARSRSRPTAARSTRRCSTPATDDHGRRGVVCDGGAGAAPCASRRACPAACRRRTPTSTASPAPEVGLIVQFDGTDTGATSSAATGTTRCASRCPTTTSSRSTPTPTRRCSRGPTASAPASARSSSTWSVNPVSGKVYVSNTEARNDVRFEGPGAGFKPPASRTVRGHLHEARITVLDGATRRCRATSTSTSTTTPAAPSPPGAKDDSLAHAARHGGHRATARRSTSPPSARARSASSTPPQLENDTFVPERRRPHRGERRRPDAAWCSTRRAAASTCSPASTTRSRSSTPATGARDRRTSRCTTPSRPSVVDGPAVPLRRAPHARATARRRARAATSSATSTAWPGISAIPTTPSLNNPSPFTVRPARHRSRLPSDEGPDDDAEPARHGEPRPDALARRPHRRQRRAERQPTRHLRRGRGVQEVQRRLRGPARPRARSSPPPRCRRSPTSSCR